MSQITKKALAESLKKQMQIKPLAKITVKDVVNECGLNRRTLYYYFNDIYDLLEWIFITEISELIGKNKTYETWQKGFLEIFLYLKDNKKMVINTYKSIDRDLLENHLYNEIFKLIFEVVNNLARDLEIHDDDKIYIANFYKIIFTGIIIDWIKNDMVEDPEDIINKLSIVIEGDMYKKLLKFALNKHH